MIKLLSNRELAEKLNINLARWKRWSREFLPPDPLAGKQAGYARQYYLNDAFSVFMGGYLVGELGFSVPGARTVLADIEPWLVAKGFRVDARGKARALAGVQGRVRDFSVTIFCRGGGVQAYRLKGSLSDEPGDVAGEPVRKAVYIEERIVSKASAGEGDGFDTEKVLPLTRLFEFFLDRVDPARQFFVRNGN